MQKSEMPRKYWKNMPETAVIPALLREAPARVNSMMAKSRAKNPVRPWKFPPRRCRRRSRWRRCARRRWVAARVPLYKSATQTVFRRRLAAGEAGAARRATGGCRKISPGHPFVGPAGQLLDRALAEAGIDRKDAYVTNTVKHFKWVSLRPSAASTRRPRRARSPPAGRGSRRR